MLTANGGQELGGVHISIGRDLHPVLLARLGFKVIPWIPEENSLNEKNEIREEDEGPGRTSSRIKQKMGLYRQTHPRKGSGFARTKVDG